jgi:GMP reductase
MDISFLYDLYKQDDSQIFKINIDVPNGYSEKFADFCAKIRDDFPNAIIMAGNVVTPEMVQELLLKGVDIVKIGIGSGSVCTTRLISGVGYPQLSAVIECAEAAHGMNGHICADGGIVHPGDVAKAFGAGADFVMLGGILAGHEECEGEWEYEYKTQHGWSFIPYIGTDINNVQTRKSHFKFYGMSSATAMEKYHGEVSNYRAAEGKLVRVPYKGFVKDTIQTILGGLRSACTYAGAWRLKDLPKCTTFIRVNRTHNTVYN